jgi:hypothetical protein
MILNRSSKRPPLAVVLLREVLLQEASQTQRLLQLESLLLLLGLCSSKHLHHSFCN